MNENWQMIKIHINQSGGYQFPSETKDLPQYPGQVEFDVVQENVARLQEINRSVKPRGEIVHKTFHKHLFILLNKFIKILAPKIIE